MKKYSEDYLNYCIMSKLRQHFVKLGTYVMRLTSVVLRENMCKGNIIFCHVDCFCLQGKREIKEKYFAFPILRRPPQQESVKDNTHEIWGRG